MIWIAAALTVSTNDPGWNTIFDPTLSFRVDRSSIFEGIAHLNDIFTWIPDLSDVTNGDVDTREVSSPSSKSSIRSYTRLSTVHSTRISSGSLATYQGNTSVKVVRGVSKWISFSIV